MIPPAPGSMLILPDPANNSVSFVFQGADPLTANEAKGLQDYNGYPPEVYGFRHFQQVRAKKWWATQWWCNAEPIAKSD